jgi:hypothetical protein
MGILMRKDSPLAQKEVITPADLQGVPLLASSRRHFFTEVPPVSRVFF